MDWTKNIHLLFDQVKELARYGSDFAVRDVMLEGTPEITDTEYDNWNGGTTYYDLTIHIPPHVYASKEDELERAETKILDWIKKIQRSETNDFITKVLIQPAFSSELSEVPVVETPYWATGHFKLFVSHLSADKTRATNLKNALSLSAISCFIAHEDIEPTKEWQEEIEKALYSMDALVAILTEKFHESKWTDQEVGVALGRRKAVVPLRAGLDPYGLMGKFQGIATYGKSVTDVAQSIVTTLLRNSKTRPQFVVCLVEQLLAASDQQSAHAKLDALELVEEVGNEQLSRLRENAVANTTLYDDPTVLTRIDDFLAKHGAEPVKQKPSRVPLPDDIPF